MYKDVVCGLGEIGLPIYKIISKVFPVEGYDIDSSLIPKSKNNFNSYKVRFLHVCIPFNKNFIYNVMNLEKKFSPKSIVIHSTIKPGTTDSLQKKLKIPVIFSATRGVHKRMQSDLKKYTKFFAISDTAPKKHFAVREFKKHMSNNGVKTKQMSTPETLELGKILCDTSYLGWLVNYAQLSNMIAIEYNVNYDENLIYEAFDRNADILFLEYLNDL